MKGEKAVYKALYRKWRPMTFDDVISQEYTTEALKNQIISGKTAHAYLFTGSRGTGKTTCARILAKAVNCRNMKDGNPCLECDICRDADSGALTDIVEIDAASNNGVDNIRDLRDAAIYTPERGAFKIYIIDEVHMLSAGAFNALLKIMEEPPPYVKFILATTEIHKVPATIVSRCQRYDFRRIKAEDIAKRISYIASQEDISLTEDGAAMIAKLADGGMRDAVSLLDQCSVCAEIIDAEAVSNAAGIAGRDYLYNMLEAITDSDTANSLSITASLYDMSKDLARLCDELIMQFRNVMLIKASPENAEKLIVCIPDEMQRLKAIAEKSDLSAIMDRLSSLQECRDRMQNAMNKRVEFEMSLIKLCGNVKNAPESIDNSEIYDKIKQLEDKINSAPKTVQNGIQLPEQPEILEASATPSDEKIIPTVDLKNLKPEDIRPCDRWGEILDEFRQINPAVAGSLDGSFAGTAGNYIFITAQNRFFMDLFKVKENATSLGAAIAKVLGQRFLIKAKCATTVTEQRNLAESLIKKAVESKIETSMENQ
ncbi:DNA polymerase III subunit gamma/tau [Ruminococcus sp.]|uniref:DNA polymerase III subunit gamma/tau n=1 Tax=Ruminococcus sp. TaxID=41978 RepID=UPI0025F1B963|nr:DNA polymerase III subunit gamma/tau [Ruminococcus sp.]